MLPAGKIIARSNTIEAGVPRTMLDTAYGRRKGRGGKEAHGPIAFTRAAQHTRTRLFLNVQRRTVVNVYAGNHDVQRRRPERPGPLDNFRLATGSMPAVHACMPIDTLQQCRPNYLYDVLRVILSK